MVDNRTSGYFGIGGAFNFKSGDISGTAAKTSEDRQSPGMDYFQQQQQQEEQPQRQEPGIDRSAQLNATLNSMAMNNIATILHKQKRKKDFDEQIQNLLNIDKKTITEIQSDKEDQDQDEDNDKKN